MTYRRSQPHPAVHVAQLVGLVILVAAVLAGVVLGLTRVAQAASERQAAYVASLVPTPVTVLGVQDDPTADDADEAEHYLITRELGTLPIADSPALRTDDDAVAMRLRGAAYGDARACVIIENVSFLGDAVTDVRRC